MIGFHEKNSWLANTFLFSQGILSLDILLQYLSYWIVIHYMKVCMNWILTYYIIFLDNNASRKVVHDAFPVSKREGTQKGRK